jgi:hypothetical protein
MFFLVMAAPNVKAVSLLLIDYKNQLVINKPCVIFLINPTDYSGISTGILIPRS